MVHDSVVSKWNICRYFDIYNESRDLLKEEISKKKTKTEKWRKKIGGGEEVCPKALKKEESCCFYSDSLLEQIRD